MRYMIVINHPYEGSFCNAVLQAAVKGIRGAGNEADILYLDKDEFNPVMTGAELKEYSKGRALDPKVIEYQQRLQNSDHLILIFPIWWEAMPALLKGWVDKIMTKGFAYDVDKTGKLPKFKLLLTGLKGITMITTMDTPGIVYSLVFGNAVKKMLFNGTFRKIGVKNLKWLSFNRINFVKPAKREKWLIDVEKYFCAPNKQDDEK